ncbi:MAG: outer membrane protein assembly factor BamA [Silvanigrellales bacterium]|nr:outer membrane protein assembly factor BamA [Silvanigrellales bacterium]
MTSFSARGHRLLCMGLALAHATTPLIAFPLVVVLGLGLPGKARAQALVEPEAGEAAAKQGVRILDVKVEGNRAVQSDAVKGLMNLKPGSPYDASLVRRDIKAIFASGFFQDVRIDASASAGPDASGLVLLVSVVEKPSIREIRFVGFEAVTESSLSDKIQAKRYTIVDERKITGDLRVIEQQYVEKGYYLARASFSLDPTDSGEVVLTYRVLENDPVSVARVNLVGNHWFSDSELKGNMATREKRWTSFLNNAGTFKDEFVNRDKEWLAYFHRDNGFAEATVAQPQARLDGGRQNVEVSYYVEEGERFDVGKIKVTGDVLFPEDEVKEKLALKEGALFRISQFQNDMRVLSDMYGDEGYAFVDVLPKTSANRETKILDIEYVVTKGEKAYFRNIVVEGNSKTRDNVVRRNIKVTEGERFHATRLDKSKEAIERLGFFQEVQVVREPDQKNNRMDLRVKVKEKSTGQLSASIGASPSSDGREFNFFAQGQYSEANLVGKGWSLGLTANLTPTGSYGLSTNFTEPSINDGPWSSSVFASYDYEVSEPFKGIEGKRFTTIKRVGTSLGREIFVEDLRFSLGYSFERVSTNNINPVLRPFTKVGDTERISQTLTYNKTNNYLQPTSGVSLSATNTFGMKVFAGDNTFGLVEGSAAYYIPLPVTDEYLTNFRFAFEPAYVYPLMGKPIPIWERLRLGSLLNMKAYFQEEDVISPLVDVMVSPDSGAVRRIDKGGNRRLYWSGEYFFPLIPEANLRLVTFGEAGTVLDDRESFSTDKLKYDVGFGFRWLTPIAPFRFEWAWPVEKGRLGQSQFIFFIGNDNASSLTR